jgi:tetratricopeptide (TPR) repeat protein
MNYNTRLHRYFFSVFLFFLILFFSGSIIAQPERSLPFEKSLDLRAGESLNAFSYETVPPSLLSQQILLARLDDSYFTDNRDAFAALFSLEEYQRSHFYFAQNLLRTTIDNEPRNSLRRSEALLLSAMELLSKDARTAENIAEAAGQIRRVDPESLEDNSRIQVEYRFWFAEILRAEQDFTGAINYYSLAFDNNTDNNFMSLIRFRRAELYENELRYIQASKEFDSIAPKKNIFGLYASLKRASLLRIMGENISLLQELARADSLAINGSYGSYGSYGTYGSDSVFLSPAFAREEILFLRGSAYSNLHDYDSAEYYFAKAQNVLENDSLHTLHEYAYLHHAIEFERGWIKLSLGKNDEAAQMFFALVKEDSSAGKAQIEETGNRNDAFFGDEKSDSLTGKVIPVFGKADTYDDYPARARFYAGIALSRAGKNAEARDILTNLSQDPTALYSDKARYHLALVEFRSGHLLQAEGLLTPIALRRSQSGVFASILLGDIHYRRNSYAKAAEYFGFALANLPDYDTALRSVAALERGLSLLPLGSWNESAQNLKLYVSLAHENTPGLDEALFWLGRAYFRADSIRQARECFKRILDEFPNTSRLIDAQYGYAWTLFRNGEYSKADREFAKVIEMDSITKYAYDALSRRGDALYAGGDLKKALAIYNLAIDRPTFNEYRTTRSLYQTGVLRMLSDSARSAMNAFKTIFTKFPKSDILDRSYYDYAVAAFAIKHDDEANEAIRILNSKYKDSPFATKGLYLAAAENERTGDAKEALAQYKKIIREYPYSEEFIPSLFGTVNALVHLKRNKEAIAVADSFFTKNPHSSFAPRLLYTKGTIEYSMNNWKDASATFEKFSHEFTRDTLYPWSQLMLAKSQLADCESCNDATDILNSLTGTYSERDVASFAYLELARYSKKINSSDAPMYFTKAFDQKYFSSESAPIAMYEYAGYLREDNKDSSVAIYDLLAERYLAQTTVGGKALLRASEILLDASKRNAAISRLEKLAKAQEGYDLAAESELRLAKIYFREGSAKKALAEFDKAREDNETSKTQLGTSYLGSAESHIALGNKKQARQVLAELLATRGISKAQREKAKELLDSLSPKKKKKKR